MSFEPQIIDSLNEVLGTIPEESDAFQVTQELLVHLRQFFEVMRVANTEELDTLLGQMDGGSKPLFNEIGKLVRSFHEQMKTINSDVPERLGKMANEEMEDASSRLLHIVSMTESAANKTMDLSESLLEDLGNRENTYETTLNQIEQALDSGDASSISEALKHAQDVLKKNQEQDTTHQGHLTEILIAQDYQDLTGQIINRVVNLLGQLEAELISLIETFGKVYVENAEAKKDELKGPLAQDSEERQSQGDVDDLLASLGF